MMKIITDNWIKIKEDILLKIEFFSLSRVNPYSENDPQSYLNVVKLRNFRIHQH